MSDSVEKQTGLPAGTILDDRFEIKALLGAGSFGQVYRANQLVFGRPLRSVALKLFFADAVTPDNVNAVFSDALTLLGLQEEHPDPLIARHLVQVYDMGLLENDRRAFMSMRLVPGSRTLLDAVHRHRPSGMPVELALRFLRQMLVPLAWMHTLDPPVVHGDLKPDNVLLTTDTELVLTDFGLAARLPLGTRGGAIAYQAPETLNRLTGLTQSDLYAVGIILYEMLTGRHPFADVGADDQADGDQGAYLEAHRRARKWEIRPASPWNPFADTERIVPPADLNSEMERHPQLAQIIARCLRWSESERYANAKELLDDVDQYIRDGVAKKALSAAIIAAPSTDLPSLVGAEQSPASRLANAQALHAQGQFTQALSIATELVRDDLHLTDAWLVKVRTELALGQIDRARQTCAEAQRAVPRSPEVLDVAAEVLDASDQKSMAASYRQRAAKMRQPQTR